MRNKVITIHASIDSSGCDHHGNDDLGAQTDGLFQLSEEFKGYDIGVTGADGHSIAVKFVVPKSQLPRFTDRAKQLKLVA